MKVLTAETFYADYPAAMNKEILQYYFDIVKHSNEPALVNFSSHAPVGEEQ